MVYWCMMGADLSLWRLYGAGRANGAVWGPYKWRLSA